MQTATAVSAKSEEKKKRIVPRNRKSSVDVKEESSKSATQSKTGARKRSSAASQGERISAEADAAVADFVQNHTDAEKNETELRGLKEVTIGEQEHQRCCQIKERNRYENVPCLDATRVVLQQDKPGGCDFLHANKCKFDNVDRQYILGLLQIFIYKVPFSAQAPMKNTFEDFWRMIFQEQSGTIIVLCDFYENGKEQAEAFWPTTTGQYAYYGKMFINNRKTELSTAKDEPDTFVVEVLPDGCSNSLIATLLHAKWPAGQPFIAHMVIKMLKHKHSGGPVTVISSQGINRAASYVAIDVTMTRLFKGVKTRMLDVTQELRKQRALALTDCFLYVFALEAVLKYIKIRVRKHADAVAKYMESLMQLKSNYNKV